MAAQSYKQAKGIATRIVDGEAFVISQTKIRHLNPVASIVWLSLTEPTRETELVEILREIFPDQKTAILRRDTRGVLQLLKQEELLTVINK